MKGIKDNAMISSSLRFELKYHCRDRKIIGAGVFLCFVFFFFTNKHLHTYAYIQLKSTYMIGL